MKTYNLTDTTFVIKNDGEQCYCALGVLLKENGYDDWRIYRDGFTILKGALFDKVSAMASYLKENVSIDADERADDPTDQVYYINDARTWAGETQEERRKVRYPADVIKAALMAAGVDVDLVDKRELLPKVFEWPKDPNDPAGE